MYVIYRSKECTEVCDRVTNDLNESNDTSILDLEFSKPVVSNTISSQLARAARPIRMRLRSEKLHSNVIYFFSCLFL